MIEIIIYKNHDYFFSEKRIQEVYDLKSSFFNWGSEDYSWVNNLEQDTTILVSGSSSVRYGINCKILNELTHNKINHANLAMDAGCPIRTFVILKSIDLTKVKKLYFGIDPWVFVKSYYKNRLSHMYLDFSFFENLLYYFEHDESALKKRYLSLVKNLTIPETNDIKIRNNIPLVDFGSVNIKQNGINFNSLGLNEFQIDKYGWSELQFDYLIKINEICLENNIEFFIFLPPKRSDYTKVYNSVYRKFHEEFLKKIKLTLPENKLHGKFDLFDPKYDSLYFQEAYHLNDRGQSEFTKYFYDYFYK